MSGGADLPGPIRPLRGTQATFGQGEITAPSGRENFANAAGYAGEKEEGPVEELLQHFEFKRLPPDPAEVSRHFHAVAYRLAAVLPDNSQSRDHLLKAKDCASRGAVRHKAPGGQS